ncbi:hypothetical protein J4558_04390 [Leptolyngbya sp. 15MV]|nr:hypothetical protein J4558_04390 [Leptolyngbya sp. 15MV]
MRFMLTCGALAITLAAAPAAANQVSLIGQVLNSCIVSIPTNGTMALSSDGTRLGSEEGVTGAPATLTVVAAGLRPTLNFSTPALSGPVGLDGATTEYAYNSLGAGSSQPYTSGTSSASSNLIDNFTIHSRVLSPNGFPSGTYTVTVTATCQQL